MELPLRHSLRPVPGIEAGDAGRPIRHPYLKDPKNLGLPIRRGVPGMLMENPVIDDKEDGMAMRLPETYSIGTGCTARDR